MTLEALSASSRGWALPSCTHRAEHAPYSTCDAVWLPFVPGWCRLHTWAGHRGPGPAARCLSRVFHLLFGLARSLQHLARPAPSHQEPSSRWEVALVLLSGNSDLSLLTWRVVCWPNPGSEKPDSPRENMSAGLVLVLGRVFGAVLVARLTHLKEEKLRHVAPESPPLKNNGGSDCPRSTAKAPHRLRYRVLSEKQDQGVSRTLLHRARMAHGRTQLGQGCAGLGTDPGPTLLHAAPARSSGQTGSLLLLRPGLPGFWRAVDVQAELTD